MLCNNVHVRRCLYFELGCFYLLIFYFETDLQLESAVCRSPYERDSIDDQLEMAALHVRWLAASFFSSRPRRFWITWNHLSNCRGLRPIEPDRGIGSRKSEVGNRKSEVGSRKSEVRSGKKEVRSLTMQHWVWTVRHQTSGVRTLSSLKSEVRSMKSEAGA